MQHLLDHVKEFGFCPRNMGSHQRSYKQVSSFHGCCTGILASVMEFELHSSEVLSDSLCGPYHHAQALINFIATDVPTSPSEFHLLLK